ncbi:hypothetical protein [Clostridium kluyveri]|uniref:Prohead protease n=1 Tax=Clostridium kluyveri TaxID=1534 RepID=A0A1L5FA27_CLOKL|nr:hypothetical protein [Clostridium kluyveri]APM39871.1 hypothetical protein BS101_14590 [Clostridium kluyveri]
MINSLIVQTLEPLKVPVSFQKYRGKENTYITFFNYLEQGEHYADNEEKETGYYIQIDVWSKNDYTELVENVTNSMKAAGFRRTSAADLFEEDTKIYHKMLRYVITIPIK